MSIDLSCQVGRENARFTAMPPCEHMDRVYDVKPVSKRTPVLVTYEKGTGRDEARISHTERGSCLDYNPKYTLVEKAVAYKFGSAARPTTVESATMDQRAEKKKQYKEMQDDLLLQKRRERQALRQKWKLFRGLTFATTTGRDSPIVGEQPAGGTVNESYDCTRNSSTIPQESKSTDTVFAAVEKKVHGGKIGKASERQQQYRVDKSDHRDFYDVVDPSSRKPARLNMQKASGRDRTSNLGTGLVTPENNREQLHKILKKVDRINAAKSRQMHMSSTAQPFLTKGARAPDFYLGGGRELCCHGKLPEAQSQVNATVADVENQSQRLQHMMSSVSKVSNLERRLQKNKKRYTMNTTDLFNYRLSDDYKLKKHYKIYQDKELVKLQEELNSINPSKVNTGGSLYRISINKGMREHSKEQDAQQAAQQVADALEADDVDDI